MTITGTQDKPRETRAQRIIECAMRVNSEIVSPRPLSEQIVLCLSEAGFLTTEALNPPTECDFEGSIAEGLR